MPLVGRQQLTPKLHKELMSLQDEPKDYNLITQKQIEYEKKLKELGNKNRELDQALVANNKELEKNMLEAKKKIAEKDSEIKKLKDTCKKLTQELEANNDAIIKALSSIRRPSDKE